MARALQQQGWCVAGTCRDEATADALRGEGIDAVVFGAVAEPLAGTTHLLSTAPPGDGGDPVLARYSGEIAGLAARLDWAGYLSTTGVYGNRDGALVDETSSLRPSNARGEARVAAEETWSDLHRRHGLKLHIFRLAGIYGPGRNALAALRTGTARRIIKPGQVFSRIHLSDILGILQASMAKPHGGAVYNVCDDEAAPPQDVVTFASQLLALPPPPEIAIDDAGVSAMARSFYNDNKLVSNDRIKKELGVVLRYPDYRRGLQALLDAGEGRDG